jgi:hypothetical protein
MLLNEVAYELDETITLVVTRKVGPRKNARNPQACAEAPLIPCCMLMFTMRQRCKDKRELAPAEHERSDLGLGRRLSSSSRKIVPPCPNRR